MRYDTKGLRRYLYPRPDGSWLLEVRDSRDWSASYPAVGEGIGPAIPHISPGPLTNINLHAFGWTDRGSMFREGLLRQRRLFGEALPPMPREQAKRYARTVLEAILQRQESDDV